ncbi:MAG: carbohydrate kinase family protein, partial [Bacteroidetes bacterium]|nr:carbohydrate kinase family protein [Bacteroidota bacterium]
ELMQGIIKPKKTKVVNTNGAGDAFMAGLISADLQEKSLKECATFGMLCAAITLTHHDNVHPNLQQELLNKINTHQ